MRKFPIFVACILAAVSLALTAVSATAASSITVIGGASGPTAVFVASTDATEVVPTPSPTPEPTAAPLENMDFSIEGQIGYDGLVVMTRWTPIIVTVTNNGADFDGTLGVNVFYSLTEYDRYEMPLTLAGGATKRVMMPVKPQTRQDMYAIELTKDGKLVAEGRIAPKRLLAPETLSIGLLSDEPEALTYFNQRANGLDTLRGEVWTTVPLTTDNFPESSDLMSAFTMLVVDGIDIRTLSEAQQQALSSWLINGGFVFVSGGAQAATSYPFFTQWTGLSAGKLSEVEDISVSLLNYAGIKGKTVDEPIWLNSMNKAVSIVSTPNAGLIARNKIGNGLIFTAAFDLGGKPLANWTYMSSIWPRVLRQSSSNDYVNLINRAEQSRYNYDENYRAKELVNNLRVANTESGIPVILILAVYLILVGFGGYFILKRMDRREWLWIAAPVSAIVFALLIFGLSRGSTMNKPVTLTASRITIDGDTAQVSTYLGVATPDDGELIISTDREQLPTVLRDDGYWYDDSSTKDKLFRPIDQRQLYRLGTHPAVGFATNDTWNVKMLSLASMQQEIGSFTSSVWMEADGLHGEAQNNTEYTLNNCFIVSTYGYSTIGDIMPGQKVTYEMLYPAEKIDQSVPNFKFKPNILYSTLDYNLTTQGSYYDNNIYTFLENAVYADRKSGDPVSDEMNQRMQLVQSYDNEWQFYQNRSAFYFFGFNDKLGQVAVALNDVPVTRAGHVAILANRVTFEPIGPTGEVMFPQGSIPAEIIVDEGDEKKPRLPTDSDGTTNGSNTYGSTDTYLSLGAPVAIRFVLPEWGTYDIEKMTLAGVTYESMPSMSIYDHVADKWVEQRLLSISMTGEKWAPYIDEDGVIYVRYVPNEAANRYEGMQMPTIALKGEVNEDAQD